MGRLSELHQLLSVDSAVMSARRIVQLFNAGPRDPAKAGASEPTPDHRRAQSVLTEAGLAVETIPPFGWPWNPAARMHNAFCGLDPLRAMYVLLFRRKSALICAHLESGFVLLLLRRLCGFRVPVIIWEVPWSPGWAFREFLSRFSIPRADCSVVFSTNQLSLLRNLYGESVRTAFVPFCIDVDFFRPQSPRGAAEPYILSCGLDGGRDFDLVLKASREIPAPFKIKVGRSHSFDLEGYPNVTQGTGYLTYVEYREMYAGASIVVITTKETVNACGVTSLMEAMAMGKPTIVSNNPALADYLPPPDAGVVIPVGDAAALCEAIRDLLGNPDKARAMGERAREFAVARYNPRVHFTRAAELFRAVIDGAAGKA